jgi:hypothetical protein
VNLQEFNALKPGDKIENVMSNSSGEVTEVNQGIVKVRWDGVSNGITAAGALRMYSVHSTIWFHWSKPEEAHCPGLEKCEREDCQRSEQCLGGSIDDYNRWAGAT